MAEDWSERSFDVVARGGGFLRVTIVLAPFVLGSGIVSCSALLDLHDFSTVADAGPASAVDAPITDARDADALEAPAVDTGVPGATIVAVTSDSFVNAWCALTADGDVYCWGDNAYGELGNGSYMSSAAPSKVMGLPPASQVVLGAGSACAVSASGGAFCWGLNPGEEPSATPTSVEMLESRVRAIAPGDNFACALRTDGSVWCWGYFGSGGGPVPLRVPPFENGVTSLAVGFDLACAVMNGGAWCWGGWDESPDTGALGNGTTGSSKAPVPVSNLTTGVTAISVSVNDFACALTVAGEVFCWGGGTSGQLGDGQFASSPIPVRVSGLTKVTEVATGILGACARTEDGSVWCWGFGEEGAIGNGPWEGAGPDGFGIGEPARVEGLPDGGATFVSGGVAPCAVTKSSGVECWGSTGEVAAAPVTVSNRTGALSVSVGGRWDTTGFACAVGSQPTLTACWGDNTYGQLGIGTDTSATTPVMTQAAGVTQLAAGDLFACAIVAGVVGCWGDNSSGQLGNQSMLSSSSMVPVQGLPADTMVQVAAGGYTGSVAGGATACAVTSGGAAYCWGDNTSGQLGNGTTTSSLAATPVSGLSTGVASISVGAGYVCALLSNATVSCWGNNAFGQLGNGSQTSAQVPTEIAGLTGVTALSAGEVTACVVSQGAVLCWGSNGNFAIDRSSVSMVFPSPVAIPTLTAGVTDVAVGGLTACAIMGGGLWCWGDDVLLDPAVGNVNWVNGVTAPLPVTGLASGVTAVAVGNGTACAIVGAEGNVSCWGSNAGGQLGNGGPVNTFTAAPMTGFP